MTLSSTGFGALYTESSKSSFDSSRTEAASMIGVCSFGSSNCGVMQSISYEGRKDEGQISFIDERLFAMLDGPMTLASKSPNSSIIYEIAKSGT